MIKETRHPQSQRGFSLLEVLIAIVVVSVGLLTVAALQIMTKKANYEAIQRTTASLLTYQIAERMRANSNNLANYLVDPAAPLGGGSIAAEPVPGCTPAANDDCSPTELAAHDLWEWEQILDGAAEMAVIGGVNTQTGGLVSPSACIEGTGLAGLYTIAIAWRGTTPLSNPATHICGQGLGRYGPNDEYRRVLVFQIFIS